MSVRSSGLPPSRRRAPRCRAYHSTKRSQLLVMTTLPGLTMASMLGQPSSGIWIWLRRSQSSRTTVRRSSVRRPGYRKPPGKRGRPSASKAEVFVGAEDGEEVDDVGHEAGRLLGVEVLIGGGQLAPDRVRFRASARRWTSLRSSAVFGRPSARENPAPRKKTSLVRCGIGAGTARSTSTRTGRHRLGVRRPTELLELPWALGVETVGQSANPKSCEDERPGPGCCRSLRALRRGHLVVRDPGRESGGARGCAGAVPDRRNEGLSLH